MKDEAGSHLNNEENDSMLDNAYGEESLDELTASVMLMARLQPAAETTDTVTSYDDKAELETFKNRVKTFESQTVQCLKYKETCDDLKPELRNDKDTIDRLLREKDKIQSDYFKIKKEKLLIQHETQLAKKALESEKINILKILLISKRN
ncbi:hypothetical protein Tco_1066275 [Tanacetum coccineum]|uniref:Uncharacterized protein n=1 Tax=Tanacetum coccineum TaxID=301880 RepID=A0ABQ5H9L8_9ASTR